MRWPAGGDQPKFNNASPMYHRDVSDALTLDHKHVTAATVNPTESAQEAALNIERAKIGSNSGMRRITAASLDAAAVPGQETQVKIEEHAFPEAPNMLRFAPISINVYEFEVLG
jgi:hypothetical protein